nr:hypothetical protein [Pseudoalteromonas sp. NBT06-2]
MIHLTADSKILIALNPLIFVRALMGWRHRVDYGYRVIPAPAHYLSLLTAKK